MLEVGEGVTGFRPGERVAYAMSVGAYAERRVVDQKLPVHVPEKNSDETAAVMMLKGLTAQYLLRRTLPVKAAGQTILI